MKSHQMHITPHTKENRITYKRFQLTLRENNGNALRGYLLAVISHQFIGLGFLELSIFFTNTKYYLISICLVRWWRLDFYPYELRLHYRFPE